MGKYALLRKDRVPYPKPLSALHEENTPLENGMIVGIKAMQKVKENVIKLDNMLLEIE